MLDKSVRMFSVILPTSHVTRVPLFCAIRALSFLTSPLTFSLWNWPVIEVTMKNA